MPWGAVLSPGGLGCAGCVSHAGFVYLGYPAQPKRRHSAPCNNPMICLQSFWQASVTAGLTSKTTRTRNGALPFQKAKASSAGMKSQTLESFGGAKISQQLGCQERLRLIADRAPPPGYPGTARPPRWGSGPQGRKRSQKPAEIKISIKKRCFSAG